MQTTMNCFPVPPAPFSEILDPPMIYGTHETTCVHDCIVYCVYLGSPFMNAPVSVQIGEHIAQKQRHIRKIPSLLSKNEDALFKVKWTTWNSAMMSAILYGCENWMTKDMRSTEQPFVQSLKELLGVRTQTCSDLVYLELGIGSAKATVARRQLDFLSKQRKKEGYINSLLFRTITLPQNARCPMGIYLNSLDQVQGDSIQSETRHRRCPACPSPQVSR